MQIPTEQELLDQGKILQADLAQRTAAKPATSPEQTIQTSRNQKESEEATQPMSPALPTSPAPVTSSSTKWVFLGGGFAVGSTLLAGILYFSLTATNEEPLAQNDPSQVGSKLNQNEQQRVDQEQGSVKKTDEGSKPVKKGSVDKETTSGITVDRGTTSEEGAGTTIQSTKEDANQTKLEESTDSKTEELMGNPLNKLETLIKEQDKIVKAEEEAAKQEKTQREKMVGQTSLLGQYQSFLEQDSQFLTQVREQNSRRVNEDEIDKKTETNLNQADATPETPLETNHSSFPLLTPIDLQRRLQFSMPKIDFSETTLSQLFDLFTQITGAPVSISSELYIEKQELFQKTFSLQQQETTLGELFGQLLQKEGLQLEPRRHYWLLVSTDPKKQSAYLVEDLVTSGGESNADLLSLLQPFQKHWRDPALSEKAANELTANPFINLNKKTQTLTVGKEIAHLNFVVLFLEKLRSARGIDRKTSQSLDRYSLEYLQNQQEALLNLTVTTDHMVPQNLTTVSQSFFKQTGATILVDWENVLPQLRTGERKILFPTKENTLREAIDLLCKSENLVSYPLGPKGIYLTTPTSPNQLKFLEFYQVGDLVEKYTEASRLTDRLKATLSTEVAMTFDPISKTLIFSGIAESHQQLEETLKTLRMQ